MIAVEIRTAAYRATHIECCDAQAVVALDTRISPRGRAQEHPMEIVDRLNKRLTEKELSDLSGL